LIIPVIVKKIRRNIEKILNSLCDAYPIADRKNYLNPWPCFVLGTTNENLIDFISKYIGF